jgi:hypothetical protein
MKRRKRIGLALLLAHEGGGVDGSHHKMWVIDQMVRALTGCPMVDRKGVDCNGKAYDYQTQGESDEYVKWVAHHNDGDEGPSTYEWDEGTP